MRYKKNTINDLKSFLYSSYAHDSKLESIIYDCKEDAINVILFNPAFDSKISLTFLKIGLVLKLKSDWSENRDTVLSLTAEDDFSYLNNYLLPRNEQANDSLYLLFQMFSGDELHIVSNELIVEVTER